MPVFPFTLELGQSIDDAWRIAHDPGPLLSGVAFGVHSQLTKVEVYGRDMVVFEQPLDQAKTPRSRLDRVLEHEQPTGFGLNLTSLMQSPSAPWRC